MTFLAKLQTKPFLSYLALEVGTLSLSLSAIYVRWADAPGTVTGFYRLFISTIIIFPIFIKRNIAKDHLTWLKILPPIQGGCAWQVLFHYGTHHYSIQMLRAPL